MRLVVVIEGGVVQSIIADSSVTVVVKDYDTEEENPCIDSDGNRYWGYRASVHIDEHMVASTMKEVGQC